MINEKVVKLIADQLGLQETQINTQSELVADLGADSLDVIELVMDIEREFDIELSEEEYEQASTVEKIIQLVESKIN